MRIIAKVRRTTVALMVSCMLVPQVVWAQEAIDESPNEWAMVGDLLVARPIGVVLTVGGAAVWLVSLPFTLLAGNASEAAGTLIGGPAETTFMRCLGCRDTGYTGKDAEAIRRQNEKEAVAEAEYPES
ncbi:MAG: hypothetical protein P8J17_08800 [Halioglobus sp.]|nr:hypothetical protein [Halioglobus sp.]